MIDGFLISLLGGREIRNLMFSDDAGCILDYYFKVEIII